MDVQCFLQECTGAHGEFLLQLAELSRIHIVKNGTDIIQQGMHQDFVTLLIEGLFAGYYVDREGIEIVDCFCFQRGDLVMAPHGVLKPSKISIKALEDSRVLQIRVPYVLELIEKYPEGMEICNHKLIKALEQHREIKNAIQRWKGKELYLWFSEEYPGLIDCVPHKYIASFLGMTEVHFSRIHKKASGDMIKSTINKC